VPCGKIKDKSKKIKVEEKKNNLCDRLFEFAENRKQKTEITGNQRHLRIHTAYNT